MTFSLTTNPTRSDLLRMSRDTESFRAIRDPQSGDIHAWPASEARHIDVVNSLGLDFRTKTELQKNSFLFSRAQLEAAEGAHDLDELVKMMGG